MAPASLNNTSCTTNIPLNIPNGVANSFVSDMNITLESCGENAIIEIGYDGHEFIQPPPSLSEDVRRRAYALDFSNEHELYRIAKAKERLERKRCKEVVKQKLKFGNENCERMNEEVFDFSDHSSYYDSTSSDSDIDLDDEKSKKADEMNDSAVATHSTNSPNPWPWESVCNRLKDALTEISVLSDVLFLSTKDCGKDPVSGIPRRYMVLDGPIQLPNKDDEDDSSLRQQNAYIVLLAKKRACDAPSRMLQSSAEHLRRIHQSHSSANVIDKLRGIDVGGVSDCASNEKGWNALNPVNFEVSEEKVANILNERKKKIVNTQFEDEISSADDFHVELLRLRRKWRLKKVGSHFIIGDLGWASVGSLYSALISTRQETSEMSGRSKITSFRVKKHEYNNKVIDKTENKPPPLCVEIAPDIANVKARIIVRIVKTSAFENDVIGNSSEIMNDISIDKVYENVRKMRYFSVIDFATNCTGPSSLLSKDCLNGNSLPATTTTNVEQVDSPQWQLELERAQNVIFCREIFSHLTREAINDQHHQQQQQQSTNEIFTHPHHVSGNVIRCKLLNNFHLHIEYLTSESVEKEDFSQLDRLHSQQDVYSSLLEHCLHQFQRSQHHNTLNPDGVSLSWGPLGLPWRRRWAGPRSMTSADFSSSSHMVSGLCVDGLTRPTKWLKHLITYSKHILIRKIVMNVLDKIIASSVSHDPLIISHWSVGPFLNLEASPTSNVKVNLMSCGYDAILKTQFIVQMKTESVSVVCKDFRHLNFVVKDLEHDFTQFVRRQIQQHLMNGVQALCRYTGWVVCSATPLFTSTSLLASPDYKNLILVTLDKSKNESLYPKVFIKKCSIDANNQNSPHLLETDKGYREVDIQKMDGKNLFNKVEMLMAILSVDD